MVIVYDYNGNPICKLKLFGGYGVSITVDNEMNTLYILQPPCIWKNKVFKYNIPTSILDRHKTRFPNNEI
jgi:hypothetical protein